MRIKKLLVIYFLSTYYIFLNLWAFLFVHLLLSFRSGETFRVVLSRKTWQKAWKAPRVGDFLMRRIQKSSTLILLFFLSRYWWIKRCCRLSQEVRHWYWSGGTGLDAAFRTSTVIPIKYYRDASGILSVEGLNHNRIIGSSKTERLA